MSLFAELKRRNVFRVGIAYALMAWVLLQGADFVLDLAGAPDWVIRALAVAVAIGLPIALFFAWAFELTPEGIKREAEVDRSQSITPKTGRKLDYAIISFLALVIVLMGVERWYFAEKGSEPFSSSGPQSGRSQPEKGSDPFSDPISRAPAEMSAAGTPEKPAPTTAPKTIAVLPFADMSQAQDQGWFADGLAEEILNALARAPDLLVASRTSSFRYKDSELDITGIAAALGVAHVLEGSVRSSGDRIRVTAQLIRAADGFHLWSQNYDRSAEDMITIQEDLARNIASALQTSMDPEALARMSSAGTDSVEAYQHFLKGLALFNKQSRNEQEAMQAELDSYAEFEQARQLDPGFAAANAMAANFWLVQLSPTRTASGLTDRQPREMLAEYDQRMDQAIASAADEIERAGYLGLKAATDFRLREALQHFQRYVAERPSDFYMQTSLLSTAAFAEEHAIVGKGLDLMAERGQSDYQYALAYMNGAYRAGREQQAAEFGLAAIERWPTDSSLLYQAHRTLMWAGRTAEARKVLERYERLAPEGNPLMRARQACGEGDRAAVEGILAQVDPAGGTAGSTLWHLYMLLDEKEKAREVLEPLAESGIPVLLGDYLGYHKFDPRPFPSLMAVLEREGVQRSPAVEIPFKCPPANG